MCERVPHPQGCMGGSIWRGIHVPRREQGNYSDQYTVAVIKDSVVVGHLPWFHLEGGEGGHSPP